MIDVVIAGGGPNGLMLACELALAGMRPVVLERLTEPGHERRANGLVGEVVRLMDRRGLYERLTGTPGAPEPVPGFVFGAFPLPLADLDHHLYTLAVPQRRIEAVLAERAAELGVDIRRGHEVTGLVQDEDAVTVEIGGREPVRARFLVGADGGHSVVRKLTGIGFPGVTSDDSVAYSGDVTVPPELIGPGGELVVPGFGVIPPFQHLRTDRGLITWAPFPDRDPMVSTTEWGPPAEGEATLDALRASAARVLGADLPLGPPSGEGPHLLRRLFGGNTRIAERYRDRRVFLLGDAAHVHSAIGGPGLNLGLQDAVNLGWKLAAAVRGEVDVLDTYESERRPVAQRVAMHTQAQSLLIRPGGDVTAFRELFAELLSLGGTRQHIADLMAGSDIRYDMGAAGERVGWFAPDLPGLRELTRGGRALLLDPAGTLDAGPWRKSVDVVEAPGLETAYLLRPDCFIAWTGEGGDGLHDALTRWFGPGTD
ncbi:FAD-dependent monooxygenase [Amycolatopsis endophytica]|uniref:2-polyprenyl-6-methoxyphenol hydroxylase-like FAD-dependent oxidoreductase n=1 Tax=Amycolatopsis endophytica TaxID=860233 RepID=A0A853B5C6_9PSEU|nr:FAD-dependent monooxygenase [Amycolatopsis endophytica]NYI90015.1 2-polyprenyl-6-methoxyphenol hydroxylase-like FAD-dependent oxidoreductase [Amycolatopsis endophytica]